MAALEGSMKRLTVPLFGFPLLMSNDEAEVRDYITKTALDPDIAKLCDDAEGISAGFSDKKDGYQRVIAVFDGRVGSVAHEAVHMSWDILGGANVPITDENNEAQAFLVDWIVTTYLRLFKSA